MDNVSKTIGKNIGILCRQLNIFLNRELCEYDVTASEIMYLGSLFLRDGVSQEELAKEFCVDKAAVTRTIATLENKGLVIRKSSETDKRSKNVFLTKEAYKYKDILNDIQEKWYEEALCGIDSVSITSFAIDLETISNNTRKLNEPTK